MCAAKHAIVSGWLKNLPGYCALSQIGLTKLWAQFLLVPHLACLACGCAKEHDLPNKLLADIQTNSVVVDDLSGQAMGEREQDLGFVLAGDTRVCDFILKNNTDQLWQIRSVQPGCSCMVPNIPSTKVPPGERTTVTIAYKAPNANLDDVKNVRVQFSGSPGLPDAILVVRAKVRKRMAVFPSDFQLGLLPSDSRKEIAFDVENYTGTEWSNINIDGFDGFSFTCSKMDPPNESQHRPVPTQAWRVSAVVEAGPPSADAIRRSVRIRASRTSEAIEELAAFQWRSGSGVLPVPSELSLGKVAREVPVVSRLTLIATTACEHSISDLVITCEPSATLSATVKQVQGRVMTVNVLLNVPEDYPHKSINGFLRVHDRATTRELAAIPITARFN